MLPDPVVLPVQQAVRLSGTRHDQGLAHGRAAQEAIKANVTIARRALSAGAGRQGLDPASVERVLAENEAFAERDDPGLIEELHGIAEGAGVDYPDVRLLNLPLFLVLDYLSMDCTQVLVTGPATGDGTTCVAKTRDLALGRLRHLVLHRTYPDLRQAVEVGVAGSVTWPGSGINSSGLALGTSGVWSPRGTIDLTRADSAWFLVNTHLLLRRCDSVEQVIAYLGTHGRLTNLNIVAADGQSAAAIETTAHDVAWSPPSDGVIVLTNHFTTPRFSALSPTAAENPSSYHRRAVAWATITASPRPWTAARVARLLASHEGDPQRCLCRHAAGGGGAETVYASVAELPVGRLTVFLDAPCRALETAPSEA